MVLPELSGPLNLSSLNSLLNYLKMSPSISGFFSSFLSTVHADAPEEKQDAPEEKQDEPAAKEASEPQTEAVEEEEPEDVRVLLRARGDTENLLLGLSCYQRRVSKLGEVCCARKAL